jgi:hypothetical protein
MGRMHDGAQCELPEQCRMLLRPHEGVVKLR